MKITTEMAAHIAALSRLKLSEEAGRMAGELEQILSYMDVLDGLDTQRGGAHEPHRPPEERAAGG